MLVYRIEDREGRGAFSDLYHAHDSHAHDEGLRSAFSHPDPGGAEEHGTEIHAMFAPFRNIGLREKYRFACRSLHQLRMWFRSAAGRTAMAVQGGVMVTYWVPDEHVLRGRYQIAFDSHHATRISAVPANEW